MGERAFDELAGEYDSWFLKNRKVLESELRLVERLLGSPGRTLSVGCGSGLFEHLIRSRGDIEVEFGVEPTRGMGEIAVQRGMKVMAAVAEALPIGDEVFETVLFNGSPTYIGPLETAFREAWRVLEPGGYVVVVDVPAESSYGLLYRLAGTVGTWDEPFLAKTSPPHPYPIEFTAAANWRTTGEKSDLLEKIGFVDLEYAQTLTRHPRFSNDAVEDPVEGHDRGDYVGIRARRPA